MLEFLSTDDIARLCSLTREQAENLVYSGELQVLDLMPGERRVPVSYTHLDVYKRQLEGSPPACPELPDPAMGVKRPGGQHEHGRDGDEKERSNDGSEHGDRFPPVCFDRSLYFDRDCNVGRSRHVAARRGIS